METDQQTLLNNLYERQNSPGSLQLLAAQRFLYSQAKRWNNSLLLGLFILPLLFIFFSKLFGWEEYYTYWFAVASIVGVIVVRIVIRIKKNRAALIQEKFDTELLNIAWNKKIAKKNIEAEDIEKIAIKLEKTDDLPYWYSDYSMDPQHMASLKCQMENLYWSGKQRGRFANFCLLTTLSLLLLFIVFNQPIESPKHLYLLLLPYAGLILHVLLMYMRNIWISSRLKKRFFEIKLKALKASEIAKDDWNDFQRKLQDFIYMQRKAGELVPDWYYELFKKQIHTIYKYNSKGGDILIETKELSLFSQLKIRSATKNFEDAFSSVDYLSDSIIKQLEKTDAEEITLEMGLKVSGDIGAVIAKAQGEGQIKLTVKWTKENSGRAD